MKVLCLLITFPELGTRVQYSLYLDLVEEFVAAGHEVYIAALSEKREGKETYVESAQGMKILRVCCGNLFNVGMIEKGLTMVTLPGRFMTAIDRYFAGIQFDMVLYPTPPITFAPVVRKLKNRMACRTYLILRDIFPQNARDLGLMRDPFTFWYFRRKEQHLYDVSDHIGCMSQGNVDYVLRHNKVSPAKLEVLYNWERFPEDAPPPDPSVRAKHGLTGKFVAIFGGNLGPAQELEFLLELSELYKDRNDVVFLIVGQGVTKPRLERLIAKKGLNNVVMKDFIPRGEFNELLRSCDVGLINLDRRFTIPNIPSKTASYFAAGLPILAAVDAHTDYGKILDDCQAGLWSVTGDLPAYQRNFERLLNDAELRKRMGSNGRRTLKEQFTVQRAYTTIMAHQPAANGKLA